MEHFQNIYKELKLKFDEAQTMVSKISQNDDENLWSTAYSIIFSEHISEKINSFLAEFKIRINYYDPDTTYKEDIEAYLSFVEEKIKIIETLVFENQTA